MNFKLNLMLIPFTVPRTAFNYLPSCDTIILNFPFRLAKSRPMGGCSLDAHCGGCVRPTGYMVQNHVSQQTSAPVSSLDKTGVSVYNTDIRTALTCQVRSFPVASLELEENAAAFLGGGYFLRFKIPKTTVASSIRSVSTSIVVMRVTPLFRGNNLAVPYQ